MIANELNYIIKPQQEHHRQAQTVEMYRTAGEGKEGIVELSSLTKLCSQNANKNCQGVKLSSNC
jgi:hypothetical protein